MKFFHESLLIQYVPICVTTVYVPYIMSLYYLLLLYLFDIVSNSVTNKNHNTIHLYSNTIKDLSRGILLTEFSIFIPLLKNAGTCRMKQKRQTYLTV